jgi:signal transduction histidine kinase/CheY-like chemotaxis protein
MDWDRGVMERGTVVTHEEHLTAAGVARVYTSTKAPYRDGEGNIIGLIGISRDITDQKRAEARIVKLNQELLRMVAELETLFEVIPIGIGVSEDAACATIKMNPALAELFRMPIDANPSKHAADVTASGHFTLCRDGRDIPKEELPFLTATRTGKPSTNVEMQIVHNDGSSRFVMTNAAPLFDEAGQPRGAIGVFWDTTEFKATAQLRAAKEAAESANKAKDQFLATISHELRTPISAILIWTNLLKSANLSDENRRAGLDIIFQCAKDQSQLVNDLLDASRLLYGKVRAELAPVEMMGLIRTTADALRPTAEAKGVELELSLSDVTLMGDALLLKQSVGNLLINAIKFTPGGGKVTIRLQRSGDEAIVQIDDDGEGISPEFLPHLFDSFRQADSSSIRKHGGLGLGLSIVRHLVELHGGTVRAASAGVGRGASFTMSIPLGLAGGLDRSRQMTGMFDAPHGPMPALEGAQVLIVEDDTGTRNSLAVLLETLGAKVSAAASVAEAWAVLGTEKPDVLISDIAMPGEDGYELIRRLRASEGAGGAKIPAIALTACASDEDRSKSLASGFDVYLAKPVEPEQLIRAVTSVVKGRSGTREWGNAPQPSPNFQ